MNLKVFYPKFNDPRWPMTPHLFRSHVQLYPGIIMSKSKENISLYVDTMTTFSKL